MGGGFPFELNGPLAFQPGLFGGTERILVDVRCRWQKARAVGRRAQPRVRPRSVANAALSIAMEPGLVEAVPELGTRGAFIGIRPTERVLCVSAWSA
jgi:hypothetical protein